MRTILAPGSNPGIALTFGIALMLSAPMLQAQISVPSPAHGELEATIRVLTYNIMGKGDFCGIRHRRFGGILANGNPVGDIVGLQEFFGTKLGGVFPLKSCNSDILRESMTKTGRYLADEPHPCSPSNRFPKINGCLFKPKRTISGGVALLTQHEIEFHESDKWDDHTGQVRPQGYAFVRIRLNSETSASRQRLDIYVVHLQGECGIDCQRKELEQLVRRITANSRTSGNPVLVIGDFNFAGPGTRAALAEVDTEFPGYRHIMEVLRNPSDLWLEAHPLGPAERGFTGDDCPIVRPVLDSPELDVNNFRCIVGSTRCGCRGKRIDYIFHLTDSRFTNSAHQVRFVSADEVRTVRAFDLDSEEGGPRRISVSDHYGVEATLEIRRPPTIAPVSP